MEASCNVKQVKAVRVGRIVALFLCVVVVFALVPAFTPKAYASGILWGGETITANDTYQLTPGATGQITIGNNLDVTIVGNGVSSTGKANTALTIVVGNNSKLTLQDVWIANNNLSLNAIDFTGTGTLYSKGTNLLEGDGEMEPEAVIHVGPSADAYFQGDSDSELYVYKHRLGAGIGSDGEEQSGKMHFESGNWFLKGSKLGAVIGNDHPTEAAKDITISGGRLFIEANSRGAAIGGSNQGRPGNVYVTGGQLYLFSDWEGPAFGGRENSDKGNLIVSGGSIKTVAGANTFGGDGAQNPWGLTSSEDTITPNTIMSTIKNPSAQDLTLLRFDASAYSGSTTISVDIDGQPFYTGSLYDTKYAENISFTPDNWVSDTTDDDLYFFVTKQDHSITVRGDTYLYGYNVQQKKFDIVIPATKGGLSSAIASITAAADAIVISVNGSDVNLDKLWVTQAERNALNSAITGAQAVVDDTDADQEQINTAASVLTAAYSTFIAAQEPGAQRYDIASAVIATISSQVYTGSAVTPSPQVSMSDTTLVKDTDYTVSYSNNTNVGTATITITGIGSYTGTKSASFVISANKEGLSSAIVAASVAKSGIHVSSDGNDVDPSELWVTQLELDALNSTIDAAQEILDDEDASQTQVDGAVNALNTARNAFVTIQKPGSKKPTDVFPTRLFGSGRYDTMAAVNAAAFNNDDTDTVILATGRDFPDALAAAGLAGIKSAPILLTEPTNLSPQARQTIVNLDPSSIYIIGGTNAISQNVENQLIAAFGDKQIERLAGSNRADTALKIYREGASGWSTTAIIVDGGGYADALSISPYSYTQKVPIFLSNKTNGLDAATLESIREGGFSKVLLIGGTAAVPDIVTTQLNGITTQRIFGQSRYETSVEVAEFSVASTGGKLGFNNLVVTTGKNFADALSGGAFAGKIGSVLLLMDDSSGGRYALDALIAAHKDDIGHVNILGGINALPDALALDVENAYK